MIALLVALALGQSQPFVGMPPDSVTTKDQTYWVGPGGSDGFDCLQPNRPCKTIQGAYDKVPKNLYHHQTVQLLGLEDGGITRFVGAYINGFNSAVSVNPDASIPNLELRGKMGMFPPDAGTGSGLISSVLPQASSAMPVITDTTQNWADGGLIGQFFAVVSKVPANYNEVTVPMWPIIDNTATTVTLAAGATATNLDAGMGYEIQQSVTRVNQAFSPVPGTSFSSVATSYPTGTGLAFINNRGNFYTVFKVGLETSTAMPIGLASGLARLQVTGVQVIGAAGSSNGITTTSRERNGLISIRNLSSVMPTGVGTHVLLNDASAGMSVSSTLLKGGNQGVNATAIQAGSAQGVIVDGAASGWLVGSSFNLQFLQNTIRNCTTVGWTSTINSPGFPYASAQFSGVNVSANAIGIQLEGTSALWLRAVIGTGNTTALKLSFGAKARVDTSTTFTGTTEVSLDGTASDYATMRAASPKLVTNTYGSIFFE
jgi:hypothetical protein